MEIELDGKTARYHLQYKPVKNINVRIKPDGIIYVSAPWHISCGQIESFLKEKADFILRALKTYETKNVPPKIAYYTEKEIKAAVLSFCQRACPYFEKQGIAFPEIRFRSMVSRWGSCQPAGGVLTFSTNLMYTPPPLVEYVVLHEFTHFLQANHSPTFYNELEKVCPDWQERRKQLKEIRLR